MANDRSHHAAKTQCMAESCTKQSASLTSSYPAKCRNTDGAKLHIQSMAGVIAGLQSAGISPAIAPTSK
jgi:hypothetical protein